MSGLHALVRRSVLAALAMVLVAPGARADGGPPTIVVSPDGPVRSVGAAVRMAKPGTRVLVRAGTYHEPMIVIDRPLVLEGEPGAVLDGDGVRQILAVTADDVTIRGLTFRHVGVAFTEDMAAIRVIEARRCDIEHNRIEDGFFGIYLARVTGCRVAHNVLRAHAPDEAHAGNGIHLWTSTDVTIEDNDVRGHRDGIYFEFVHEALVRGNRSEGNLRYGLHFMYSDDCRYRENTFRANGAGVAVMYTRDVEMTGNRFEDNWGSAAYGLLLKEITRPVLRGNHFVRNTVGLMTDGTSGPGAEDNEFTGNGWALKLMANDVSGRLEHNDFSRNTFDIATNGTTVDTRLRGNWFADYAGYDLDRDGTGDVPHHPVRLFSVIVERNSPAMILLRSEFVALLDLVERVLPAITPADLVDPAPAMRPVAGRGTAGTTTAFRQEPR